MVTIAFVALLNVAPFGQGRGDARGGPAGRATGPSQMTVVSGSLTGTVRDQSRALVSGIQITVRLETVANVQPHRTTTDQEGRFRFTRLPLGTYCLTVNQRGVGATTRTGIQVRGAQPTNVSVVLGEQEPAKPSDSPRRRSCSA